MGVQKQPMVTLSPQPSLVTPGTPQRISTVSIFVRSVIFESAQGNRGALFVADSESKASTINRHALAKSGDMMSLETSPYGNLETYFDLRDFWFDGDKALDKIVVSYLELTEKFE